MTHIMDQLIIMCKGCSARTLLRAVGKWAEQSGVTEKEKSKITLHVLNLVSLYSLLWQL